MNGRMNEPVFIISVAARLVQMHPQTLRKYEREGLIEPSRTVGNLRLYSDQDIERLRQVKYLVESRGLNLAGVQMALELTNEIRALKQTVAAMSENASVGTASVSAGQLGQVYSTLDAMLTDLGFDEDNVNDESAVDSAPARRTSGK